MAKTVSIALSGMIILSAFVINACSKAPPDYRSEVTLPLYTNGDAQRGKQIYQEACAQCHQLTPGLNKKGPQLLNIYGAPAASLADYKYSAALKAKNWVWDAKTLDPYIADSEKVVAETKMLADPMPDAKERQDVIAYLSTLRAPVPIDTANGSKASSQ
ncbi:MAG: c-type cytochrome [Psychrobacter sp.]|nr:c-type cytochrome [Psychrobacter sp.]